MSELPSASAATVLQVPGATRRFTFVHWTDIHLCACDERNAPLVPLMAQRAERFGGGPDAVAADIAARIRAIQPEFVAVTGDVVDQPTAANLEAGMALWQSVGRPVYIAPGNHEYYLPSDPQSRDHWRRQLACWTDRPLDWHAAECAGVRLLFVDNSDYQITPEQLQRTTAALDEGKPCLLFLHIPCFVPSLVPDTLARWGTAILMGAGDVPPANRQAWAMGERNEPATVEFCRLLTTRPNLLAVFAGHLHFNHEDQYAPGRTQYVTGGGFESHFRIVRVDPA